VVLSVCAGKCVCVRVHIRTLCEHAVCLLFLHHAGKFCLCHTDLLVCTCAGWHQRSLRSVCKQSRSVRTAVYSPPRLHSKVPQGIDQPAYVNIHGCLLARLHVSLVPGNNTVFLFFFFLMESHFSPDMQSHRKCALSNGL